MDEEPVDDPRLQVAVLQGRVQALEGQLAMLAAADEHRRAELQAALTEAAEARGAQREWQARLDDSRSLIAELRARLAVAEEALARAEEERAAVIAALGRRAKKELRRQSAPA